MVMITPKTAKKGNENLISHGEKKKQDRAIKSANNEVLQVGSWCDRRH